MTYTLKLDGTSLEAELRKVAADQLDRGIASLSASEEDRHEAVHDARKRCKKVRGLIRLFRGSFPDYATENAALRDAARGLSDLRDATAVIETYDRLMARYGDLLHRPAFGPVRAYFTRTRQARGAAGDLQERMDLMRTSLETIRGRVDGWTLEADGIEAIEKGLTKTLGRARDAMNTARETRDPEDLHDWRKRVKYHWYQMRLLSDTKSDALEGREDAADRLADLLGDHHDLVETLPRLDEAPLADDAKRVLRGIFHEEMRRLEDEALTLGASLMSRKPKKLVGTVAQAIERRTIAA